MDKLLLLGELEVDERHVLLPPQAQVLHESLEEGFADVVAVSEPARDDGVEHFGLFDASGDAEEFDNRMQVLDRVDAIFVFLVRFRWLA